MILLCNSRHNGKKTDCKNNQLSNYATINPNVNSVINGNVPYLASKDGCYMQSSVALFFSNIALNLLDGDVTSPENFGLA